MTASSEQALHHNRPCDDCGENKLSIYSNHTFCQKCRAYRWIDADDHSTLATRTTATPRDDMFVSGTPGDIPERGLSAETCRAYRYDLGISRGKSAQVANYFDGAGALVAQKVRYPDKTFEWVGHPQRAGLFGQTGAPGGPMVVVTEGEIDALSVAQVMRGVPAVSVKNGAQGAPKDIAAAHDWLASFDRIVLWFDNDQPGRDAAEECATLLPPGRVYIARGSRKDANDYLQAQTPGEIAKIIAAASPWLPKGIVDIRGTLTDAIHAAPERLIPYPFPSFNEFLGGMRARELVLLTAGTGVGKSTFMRELVAHLIDQGESVATAFLEENRTKTVLSIAGIHLNQPLVHMPSHMWPEKALMAEAERLEKSLTVVENFGAIDRDRLKWLIRYAVEVKGARWFFLDHLSMIASGTVTQDERKFLDLLMTDLRVLVEETGITLIAANHLRRPQGNKGYEDGLGVTLNGLRGSSGIAQLSDTVIGLNRTAEPNVIGGVILKNRHSGALCHSGIDLVWDAATGRLHERKGVT